MPFHIAIVFGTLSADIHQICTRNDVVHYIIMALRSGFQKYHERLFI